MDQGFVVISVAFDCGGAAAAGPWIELAKPAHPSLIDVEHRVAELYEMVNVPMAVWIDESGRIVRPAEPSGSSDGFRQMDRATKALAPEIMAEYGRRAQVYKDALRDWVRRGAESEYALPAGDVASRTLGPSNADARAHTCFALGRYLAQNGRAAEAQALFAEAVQLAPENWSIRRQALWFESPEAAGGPKFWSAVDALGRRRYYRPVRMRGLDER
jgi:hypothetical protein